MCEKCYELAVKFYPDLSDEDRGEVLMGATAFPYCSPEYLEKQLTELKEKTDGTLDAALCFADQKLEEQATAFKVIDDKPHKLGTMEMKK